MENNINTIDDNASKKAAEEKATKFLFPKEPSRFDRKIKDDSGVKKNNSKRIVKPSAKELELHTRYLKTHLQKNFYN